MRNAFGYILGFLVFVAGIPALMWLLSGKPFPWAPALPWAIVAIALMIPGLALSIDCDCVDHPEPVKLKDFGILASTDPVALDQACVNICMASNPDFVQYIIDQCAGAGEIAVKKMMGL